MKPRNENRSVAGGEGRGRGPSLTLGKVKHVKFIVSLFLSTSTFLAAAELEFAGYLRSGTEERFVVANSKDGTVSGLLSIGEKFQGYTIIGFDAKEESLALSGSGVSLKLHLKPPRASPALPKLFYLDVTPPGTIMIGQQKTDIDGLRRILGAAVAADPDVVINVRARAQADAPWLQSMFRQIRDIAESVGARGGTGLISKPSNKPSEPTPGSVTPRAAETVSK